VTHGEACRTVCLLPELAAASHDDAGSRLAGVPWLPGAAQKDLLPVIILIVLIIGISVAASLLAGWVLYRRSR
jgi:hypothetical protein